LDVLLLFFLPLLEFEDPAFVVNMTKSTAGQVSARLKVIILLSLRLHTPKQATESSLATFERTTQFNVKRFLNLEVLAFSKFFSTLHEAEQVLY